MPVGWQIIIRLADDRPIAPTPSLARRFASCAARIIGDLSVPALRVAGGHGHIEALLERREAGELARRLEIGLWRSLGHGVHWEPARIRAIHDQAHAERLFFYIQDQDRHHGLTPDPFCEASNLPDLLGARVTLRKTLSVVKSLLPRVQIGALRERAGLPSRDVDVQLDPDLLVEAAAASVGLPGLHQSSTLARLAKAAAIQIAAPVMRKTHLADMLEVRPRTLRDLRRRPVPEALRVAIARQWRWRSHHRSMLESQVDLLDAAR